VFIERAPRARRQAHEAGDLGEEPKREDGRIPSSRKGRDLGVPWRRRRVCLASNVTASRRILSIARSPPNCCV
jgi:hypothetical protein